MSFAIWPPVSNQERVHRAAETLQRELVWIVGITIDDCRELKHGLEDCYALIAPMDPGSTLVMSTLRNEKVKGTITRVGSRVVKVSLHLQLRNLPVQIISLAPSTPIHVPALDALYANLGRSIDLLGLTLARHPPHDAAVLASTLTLLADSLADAVALLKGPSLGDADARWQTDSCPRHLFDPPLPPNLSFHIGLHESSVVLSLRALEPVDAPVRFGVKLGLAIGTVRRLEHDEMGLVFCYRPCCDDSTQARRATSRFLPPTSATNAKQPHNDVYVREKVRVESADPSLISLYSKITYLSSMLNQTKHNLITVMTAAGIDG